MTLVKKEFIMGHELEVVEELYEGRPNGYGVRMLRPSKLGELLARVSEDEERLKDTLDKLQEYKSKILGIQEEYPEMFI